MPAKIKISKLNKLKTEYSYALIMRDKAMQVADKEFKRTMDKPNKELETVLNPERAKFDKVMAPHYTKYYTISDKAQAVRRKAVMATTKAFQKTRKELEDYEGELNG
jgi:hypothetical protein